LLKHAANINLASPGTTNKWYGPTNATFTDCGQWVGKNDSLAFSLKVDLPQKRYQTALSS